MKLNALELGFGKLSTYHRLAERLLHKRTLETPLLPNSNSISRGPEVTGDVILGTEGKGPKAILWVKFHDYSS